MIKQKLEVKKRNTFGRKVKKLRQEGIIPANIYGKKTKSQAVQLELTKFLPVYHGVGETGLIDILITGEKSTRPVLIHNIQFDPVTDHPIHIDFRQVSLTEKVKTEIPIELVGESRAVEQKLGILVRLLDQVEVEALPADLPEKIEVDISSLEKVNDMVKISQIKLAEKKIKILTDASTLLAKIEPPVEAEKEEEAVVEEAVVEKEEAEVEAPTEATAPKEVEAEKEKDQKKGKDRKK
ncbi:MAG TPA: 50S ribosomal protein L25 [Candidatus Bathyarchaeia archaeon]|nr:50S ribosomal protein L25 [Candidatus Bathyarchaeia archaeon]